MKTVIKSWGQKCRHSRHIHLWTHFLPWPAIWHIISTFRSMWGKHSNSWETHVMGNQPRTLKVCSVLILLHREVLGKAESLHESLVACLPLCYHIVDVSILWLCTVSHHAPVAKKSFFTCPNSNDPTCFFSHVHISFSISFLTLTWQRKAHGHMGMSLLLKWLLKHTKTTHTRPLAWQWMESPWHSLVASLLSSVEGFELFTWHVHWLSIMPTVLS